MKVLKITPLVLIYACNLSPCVSANDFPLPTEEGIEAYKNKHYDKAYKILETQASRMDIEAQYYLGLMYLKGLGTQKDEQKGFYWLERAAFYEHKKSIYNLGVLYYKGIGIQRDFKKALEYFIKSSYHQNPKAIYNIGLMYQMGQGVKQDSQLAAYYFTAAAEIGDKYAQNNLGLLYRDGKGISKSMIDAYKWLSLSSLRGYEVANQNLKEVEDWMSSDQLEIARSAVEHWQPKQYITVSDSGISADSTYPTESNLDVLNRLFSTRPMFFEKGSGTGFIINNQGYILTNAHVVDECHLLRFVDNDKTIDVKKVKVDMEHDLALLKSESKLTRPPASFALNKQVTPGESVYSIGFPLKGLLSDEPIFTSGLVNAKNGPQGDINFFQFSAPIQPGNSGGPLLDQKGNVIGISTLSLTFHSKGAAQNVNFAIKNSTIRQFLDSWGVKYQLGFGKSELSNTEIFKTSSKFISPIICLGKYYGSN